MLRKLAKMERTGFLLKKVTSDQTTDADKRTDNTAAVLSK